MKRKPSRTGLLLGLTIAVLVDILFRSGLLPPVKYGGGMEVMAAAEPNNPPPPAVKAIAPDSPAFVEYPEYPREHDRTRFFHVSLIVEDLQTSIDYYRKYFGFKLIRTQHTEGSSWHLALLTTGSGEPILELVQYVRETDRPPTGISHIGMFVSDLSGFYEASRADGAAWEGDLVGGKSPTFPRMGFMIDPDGYRVEIIENPRGNCTSCHRGPHLP